MAVEVERLIAVLEAKISKFEREMKRASTVGDREFTKIEKRGKQMESRLAAIGRGINIGKGLFAAAAGSAALRQAQALIDAATRIKNGLKAAGIEGEALARVQAGLFASATKNAAPVETLAQLYSRLSLVQKELGVDSDRLLAFTDKVALALRAGGQSAGEASGALLQLSQALGSGTVRAEEFNSILEGAPAIAQAVAAGLEETGGSVAKLRQLVIDGKISSEAFFAAFEAGAPILEQRVAGAVLTVGQALTQVHNALIEAAGKFDETTGASAATAEALGRLAGVIIGISDAFAAAANGPIGAFIGRLAGLNSMIERIMPGLNAIGALKGNTIQIPGSQGSTPTDASRARAAEWNARELGFGHVDNMPYSVSPTTRPNVAGTSSATSTRPNVAGTSSATSTRPYSITPVSLKSFAPPVSKAKSGGGGGGGRSRSSRDSQSDYQREVEQLRKRTELLNAESSALSAVNPLQSDYALQVEKARIASELLNAAKSSGLAITPELKAQIDALAGAYANASQTADQMANSQQKAAETAREIGDFGKDLVSGFISDLRSGKSAAEAFASALDKIADKLIDIALSAIFDGGGIGGLLGKLFGFSSGGLVKGYARGGYTGHGGKYQPAGVVHRGEYVLNQQATRRIGTHTLDRMNRGYASGGLVGPGDLTLPQSQRSASSRSYSPTFNIDARGADQAAVARLERSLDQFARTEGKRIDARVDTRQVRRVRG